MNWQDIRTELKKVGGNFKYQVPSQFSFVKHSSCTRLYYLGQLDQPSNTLLCRDIQPGASDSLPKACLSKFLHSDTSKNLPREQELLRERMRIKGTGISSYSLSEHKTESDNFVQIIFTIRSQLNVFRDDGVSDNSQMIFSCEGTILNPSTCPHDSRVISFVQDGDIHLQLIPDPTSLSSLGNHQVKLTHLRTPSTSSKKSAGMPSYIVQEEFDRYSGYWWKTSIATEGKQHYQLLYEEVDETDVDVLNIPSYQLKGLSVDQYNYPRSGTNNATSELKLLDFYRSDMTIEGVVERSLGKPLHLLFPGMEYLLQAGWLPHSTMVFAVMMNRSQNIKKVFLIPIENFQANNDNDHQIFYEILTESSEDHWINNHNLLHFLSSDDSNIVNVVYATEISKHLHLHHASYDLSTYTTDNGVRRPQKASDTILTAGDWDVDNRKLWVDEQRHLVYFVAYRQTPLETHLYVTSYKECLDPYSPTLLTTPASSHSLNLDMDCSYFVSSFSSLETPDRCDVFALKSEPGLATETPGLSVKSTFVCNIFKKTVVERTKAPQTFEFFNSTGTKLYGLFIEPPQSSADPLESGNSKKERGNSQSESGTCNKARGKYPVVLYVYGGPQVQIVSNSFSYFRYSLQHKIARFGFGVLMIDNRGSYHRGTQFENPIKNQLGCIEIGDQVDGLMHAQHTFQCLDLSRVGIMGWSYGGYMSLVGLAQRPDIFKVSISGAPVTSWELYDTAYTERYMGKPCDNTEAYKRSSVLAMAPKFPNEANRLLVVHGLMDENVHFFHTSSLVDALNSHCKPFTLQTYPKERHGIRNSECYHHYETLILHFLLNNL